MRLAIITDTHIGLTTSNIGPDAPYYRIGPTAITRIAQFLRICKNLNIDNWVHLGDLINTGGSGTDRIDLFKAEVDSAGLQPTFNADGYYAFGNHEQSSFVGDDAAEEFWTAIGVTYHGIAPTATKFWINAAGQAAWHMDKDNFRLVGLATGLTGGGNFDDGAYGSVATDNQDDWVNEVGGPLDTALPIIVFTHAQMTTINNIGAEEWDNGDETAHAVLRTAFENKGSIKAVFAGHHHRGTTFNIPLLADVVNGIPYFGLVGSIRGRNTSDITANAFYIFDITSAGVQAIWTFQRDLFGRQRNSMGVIPDDKAFGRDRYTF